MSQEGAADLATPATETTNLDGVTASRREFFTKRKKDATIQERQQQQPLVAQQPDQRTIKRKPASKNKSGPLVVAIRKLSNGPGGGGGGHSFIYGREEIEKAIANLREQHVSEIKKIDEALSLRWFLQFQQNTATITMTTATTTTTTTTGTQSVNQKGNPLLLELQSFMQREAGSTSKLRGPNAPFSSSSSSSLLQHKGEDEGGGVRGGDEGISNKAFKRIKLWPSPDWEYSLLHCLLYYEGNFGSEKRGDNALQASKTVIKRARLDNLTKAKALRSDIYKRAIECRYPERTVRDLTEDMQFIDSFWEGNSAECIKKCMGFNFEQACSILQYERGGLNKNRPGTVQMLLSVSSPQFELRCPMVPLELASIVKKSGESSLMNGLRETEKMEALKRLEAYTEKYFGLCNRGTKLSDEKIDPAPVSIEKHGKEDSWPLGPAPSGQLPLGRVPSELSLPEECDAMENLKKTLAKPISPDGLDLDVTAAEYEDPSVQEGQDPLLFRRRSPPSTIRSADGDFTEEGLHFLSKILPYD